MISFFTFGQGVELGFESLAGIDLAVCPFENIKLPANGNPCLILGRSRFYFYNDHTSLDTWCNQSLVAFLNKSPNLLTYLAVIKIEKTVEFSTQICPLAFQNAYVEEIFIKKMSSSFLGKNVLGFRDLTQELNQTGVNMMESLNSHIHALVMTVHNVKLDNQLLDQYVFMHVLKLHINKI